MKNKLTKVLIFTAAVSACLFAASCERECPHFNMSTSIVAPTHAEAGYTVYDCDVCYYSYNADFVAPLGHDLEADVHAPTCTAEGYTEYTCGCGYTFLSDYVSPLPHTLTETAVKPTCTSEGYTQSTCECGYTFKSDFVAPASHIYNEEIIAPTCTAVGYTLNTCNCGYSFKSGFVAPTMHSFKATKTVEATCTAEGYTTGECESCHESYTYDVVSPLGHELSVKRGFVSFYGGMAESHYSCTRCDLSYTGDYLFYKDVYHGAYVDNTAVLAKGIDVSKWNHNLDASGNYLPLDWDIIKNAGFSFVILKAGEMSSGNVFVPSPVFEMDYAGAKAAGLCVGAYIYSNAYTVDDAYAEALAMIDALDGKQFEYPIFFDIEYSDEKIAEKGLTPERLTEICCEFISTMQENGYFTALYTNNKWLTQHLSTSQITSAFDVWYARYLYVDDRVVNEATWNTDRYGKQMAMWQFSETGTIDGITLNDGKDTLTSFDLNYCYKDYPSLIKEYGLNGFPREHGMLWNTENI